MITEPLSRPYPLAMQADPEVNDRSDAVSYAELVATSPEQHYREEIAEVYKAMRTTPAKQLTLPVVVNNKLVRMPLREAVHDGLTNGAPLDALMVVLAKSDCPYVAVLRDALRDDFTYFNVDVLAELSA